MGFLFTHFAFFDSMSLQLVTTLSRGLTLGAHAKITEWLSSKKLRHQLAGKPLKRFLNVHGSGGTGLKPGVNEMDPLSDF